MPSKSTLFWRGVGHRLPGGVFGSIILKRHLPAAHGGCDILEIQYLLNNPGRVN